MILPSANTPPPVADSKLVNSGNRSSSTTSTAVALPVLLKLKVYVMVSPGPTYSNGVDLLSVRTGVRRTVTLAESDTGCVSLLCTLARLSTMASSGVEISISRVNVTTAVWPGTNGSGDGDTQVTVRETES